MKVSPSLFDSFQRLKPRERRVVLGGAIISAVVLVVMGVIVPIADHWTSRESAYAASRAQWEKLSVLAASTDRLQHALDGQKMALAAEENRLVDGTTPALAASTLQGMLQQYATGSAIQLQRVDAAGEPKAAKPGLLEIPVIMSGTGSIAGLVDFLSKLERGDKLLVIDELAINAGLDIPSASIMDVGGGQSQALQWTVRVHGLYGGTAQ
jgi:type II secretory pathway component PulM